MENWDWGSIFGMTKVEAVRRKDAMRCDAMCCDALRAGDDVDDDDTTKKVTGSRRAWCAPRRAWTDWSRRCAGCSLDGAMGKGEGGACSGAGREGR